MIKTLKIKFVALSTASLFVLLLVIVTGINLINYNSVLREADEELLLLSQNKGELPDLAPDSDPAPDLRIEPEKPGRRSISPELPYELRYFSVRIDRDGSVIRVETDHIISVDTDMAIKYAQDVFASGSSRGFANDFRYQRTENEDAVSIIFLDCGRRLSVYHGFLLTSIGMALAGFVIVFGVIFVCVGRFIRPISESYEKQKRFITDAGHEIKTPLTIIRANVDVLEMDIGQNECLEDIRQQAKRLTSLTNKLVYLARMEEAEHTLPMLPFPVSEVIQEAAQPFQALAQIQKKELVCQVQPMLSIEGNDQAIGHLVSILLDNALKYSPPGGNVSLDCIKRGKALVLTVCNTTETAISPESLSHLFDRFYRADPSRNSETGGHGIGLSVAKAIVTAHGGKISAHTPDGHTFQITVSLPV